MKERWVDIAKLVAILAVLTDHVHIILYAPLGIKYATYFSVPLFILLMGVTSFWSFEHATEPLGKKSAWRMIHIIISYAVAVFVCYIIEFREFSWIEYKNYVLHFNISGPYYYILLYLQLLAVAPLVFHFLKQAKQSRHPHIVEILWGAFYASPF